jgi:hypothetical protein
VDANTITTVEFGTGGEGDAPKVPCVPLTTTDTDNFKTYLVFNPNPDDSQNIWVTLARVDWGWHGKADLATSWSISEASTNSPSFNATDEFPVWNKVFH